MKKTKRNQRNETCFTEGHFIAEAQEGQLYGQTLDAMFSLVRLKHPIGSEGYNAVLVVHNSDDVVENFNRDFGDAERDCFESEYLKVRGKDAHNFATEISNGHFISEYGVPSTGNAFEDMANGESDSELYLVGYRNSNDRGTNPYHYRLGVALPTDNPEKFLYNRTHLSWGRGVSLVRDALSEENPDLKIKPGLLCTDSIVKHNVDRVQELDNSFEIMVRPKNDVRRESLF